MIKSVYIETTIPSYYYETRTDHKSVAWREITYKWWNTYKKFYQAVTSDFVFLELEKGKHPNQKKKINLLDVIEILEPLPIINDIVEIYIKNSLIPKEYGGDAFHLAYASYYAIDFLLTWNCAHLANPNKFHHFNAINSTLSLKTPILCTPEQLLSTGD